jgi:hypothetical protein
MLALTGFHGLTMTASWAAMVRWFQDGLGVGAPAAFSLGMVGIMAGPIVLYALVVAVSRWSARARTSGYREHFVRYAYAFLPIALFYHLAHNAGHLLMEGPRLLALLSDPFGWGWNLFGGAAAVPGPMVSMGTLWGLQVLLIATGHVYGLWASRRAAAALFPDAHAALRSQVPMLAAMILFSVMSLWLLKQPMQMRISAM